MATLGELTYEIEKLKAELSDLQSKVTSIADNKNQDNRQLIVTAYTKVIDVQMHFNEMVMRVRNIAVTLILAVFGAAAYSIQQPYFIGSIHIAALIIAFGLAAWASLWVMDLSHFHLLLRGAVKKSTDIENAYGNDEVLKNVLGMTKEISKSSRQWFGRQQILGQKVTAAGKLHFFYGVVMLIGIAYFLVVVIALDKRDFPPMDRSQVLHLDTNKLTIHIDQPASEHPQVLQLDTSKLMIHIDQPIAVRLVSESVPSTEKQPKPRKSGGSISEKAKPDRKSSSAKEPVNDEFQK